MRPQYRRTLSRLAIVLLTLAVSGMPSSLRPTVHAAPAPAAVTPRQRVTEPMVWLVPTATGYQPAEHAQPTLWIEGEAVTRYWVDRPGVERALILGR